MGDGGSVRVKCKSEYFVLCRAIGWLYATLNWYPMFLLLFFFNILHFSRIEFAANGFFPLVINGWLFVSSWLLFYINIELPASMQLLSEGDLKREKNAHTRADTQTMHDCVKSLKWTLSIHSIIETQFESTHSLGVSTMGSLCAIDNN